MKRFQFALLIAAAVAMCWGNGMTQVSAQDDDRQQSADELDLSQPPRGERRGRGGPEGRRGGPGGEEGRGGRGGPQRGGGDSIMRALDVDGDGMLSASEISGAATALATLDSDGDGELRGEELMPARGPRGGDGERGGRGGRGGDGERGGRGGPGGGDMDGMIDRVMQNDTDGDGMISVEEAPERMAGNFDSVDTNGDGFIDRPELEAMMENFRGRGGPRGEGGPRGGGDRRGGGGGDRPRRPGADEDIQ